MFTDDDWNKLKVPEGSSVRMSSSDNGGPLRDVSVLDTIQQLLTKYQLDDIQPPRL